MAKATIETKQIEVTKIEERKVIHLELSEREAAVLVSLFRGIGGSPYGPRGIVDEIALEIRDARNFHYCDYLSSSPNDSVIDNRNGVKLTGDLPQWIKDLPE